MKLATYISDRKIKGGDFAREVGISHGYLSQLIGGVRSPSLSVALKIAEVTDGAVTPVDFAQDPKGSEAAA